MQPPGCIVTQRGFTCNSLVAFYSGGFLRYSEFSALYFVVNMLIHRFFRPVLFLATLMLAVLPAIMRAGDVSWDVSGLGFSDEGTLTGTFVYDADTGVMRTWNISTVGGDPMNFPQFTYTPQNSSFSVSGSTLIFQGPLFPAINPASNGFRQLRIGPFNTPLSDAGGGRDLVNDPIGNQEFYNCGPMRSMGVSLTGTPLPDLTIGMVPSGAFPRGDVGDTYSIFVTNSGDGPTAGTVTVMDTPPSAGVTVVSISGVGWTCGLATLTCTRSDVLASEATYPAIILTVNVATNAPASITNTATVSGGFEVNTGNDTASNTMNIVFPTLICVANAAVAQVLRQEGDAEPGGDIVLSCTGGSPTPEGMPVPIVQFGLTFTPGNTVGGRILSGTTPPFRGEALALVDEPGLHVVEVTTTQLVCADAIQPCSILATGSGQGEYDGSPGRPNIFQSNAVTGSSERFNIPFDPPGSATRIIRFTNLRIDSRSVPPSGSNPAPVSAAITATSSLQVMITNPTLVIGSISNGANVSVSGGTGTLNRLSQFNVGVSGSHWQRSADAQHGPVCQQ